MNRRRFLAGMAAGAAAWTLAPGRTLARAVFPYPSGAPVPDDQIRDYLVKMENYDSPHPDDVVLQGESLLLLQQLTRRLLALQRQTGHGNYQLLSFDEARTLARTWPSVGAFTQRELDFMEKVFHEDAACYGFFGQKPLNRMTDVISRGDVVWVGEAGNYLYKGDPARKYAEIRKALGERVILTSGVRGILKQFLLFFTKACANKGNLSLASRSLAPPGYSYHGIGDFDVGQVGFGEFNFTSRFTSTEVFIRLQELGYIVLRYPRANLLGVRFEPWHIKVVDWT